MLFLSNDTALLNEASTSETVLNLSPGVYVKTAVQDKESFCRNSKRSLSLYLYIFTLTNRIQSVTNPCQVSWFSLSAGF